jgi:DNA-binding NarL/FixJ family response regulator
MAILIVEDNRHMRRMLCHMLREAFPAQSLLEAADGRDTIERCTQHRPEIVLMDVALPDANGLELTGRVTALLPGVAVIIVSNHGSCSHREHACASGAVGYIPKAEVQDALLPAVARLLDRSREAGYPR